MASSVDEKDRPSSRKALVFLIVFLAVIFYASGGFIPFTEIEFAAFASVYLFILSKVAFPPVTDTRPPVTYAGNKLLQYYVSAGAVVGLLLPLILVLAGFFRDKQGSAHSAVPHTALLVFQIISERVSYGSNAVSLPIRAFVPISYNAWRLLTIWNWMGVEFGKVAAGSDAEAGWLWFGRFVAVANMVFWSFNLFCFLLPVFLPLAMRKYYEKAIENGSKRSSDYREVSSIRFPKIQ